MLCVFRRITFFVIFAVLVLVAYPTEASTSQGKTNAFRTGKVIKSPAVDSQPVNVASQTYASGVDIASEGFKRISPPSDTKWTVSDWVNDRIRFSDDDDNLFHLSALSSGPPNAGQDGLETPLGTVTVVGSFQYYDRNGWLQSARYMIVDLYDVDTWGIYHWLATTTTRSDGSFAFPPVTNTDTGLNLYVVWWTDFWDSVSARHTVTDFLGGTYGWGSEIQYNVPDGTAYFYYYVPAGSTQEPAMWIFQDLRRGWEYLKGQTGFDPGSASTRWELNQGCIYQIGCGSLFYAGAGGPFVFIADSQVGSPDTVIHELGHNYMYNAKGYWYWDSSCWGHDIFVRIDVNCAWSEGWGDFFALAVNGDRCYDKGVGPCTGTRDWDYFDLEAHNRNDNGQQFP